MKALPLIITLFLLGAGILLALHTPKEVVPVMSTNLPLTFPDFLDNHLENKPVILYGHLAFIQVDTIDGSGLPVRLLRDDHNNTILLRNVPKEDRVLFEDAGNKTFEVRGSYQHGLDWQAIHVEHIVKFQN